MARFYLGLEVLSPFSLTDAMTEDPMLVLVAVLLAAAPMSDAGNPDAGSVYDSQLSVPGLSIDSPRPGAKLTGRWTSVSGRYDPAKYQYVAVVSAPAEGFYLPMGGHGGVPMVPLLLDGDGGFIAARVPLVEGVQQLAAVPLSRRGYEQPAFVSVTASKTDVEPMTLTATPAFGQVPLKISLAAKAYGAATKWEWAFDLRPFAAGDATNVHEFNRAGTNRVTVRARVDGEWVYGAINIQLTQASKVLAETKAVKQPSVIKLARMPIVDGHYAKPPLRWVMVIDGDEVRVFDPKLKPVFTLKGFKAPMDVDASPDGHLYVADTGHDRIVRFTPDGKLDGWFGTKGALTRVGERELKGPRAIVLPEHEYEGDRPSWVVLLDDGKFYTCRADECSEGAEGLRGAEKLEVKQLSVPMEGGLEYAPVALLTGEGWVTSDPYQGAMPLSQLPKVFACGYTGSPYFVAADGEDLVELLNAKEVRRQKMPFAVTAAAHDVRTTLNEAQSGAWGPLHLFVAGKGVLQERLFDVLDRTE